MACSSLQESRDLLSKKDVALIFCDEHFDGGSYSDLLAMVRRPRKVPVVVFVSDENRDSVLRQAKDLGAMDVMPSPCGRTDVQWMVIQATRTNR